MVGTAAASSKASASARIARSCHRTAGLIAPLAKVRPLRVRCASLIRELLISSIPQSFAPVALGNAGVELPQSVFHVGIDPADRLLPSL
jgi:hypothetical protein